MYKNVKSKIILISVLIGLILIGAMGYLYLNSLAQIPQLIDGQEVSILAQAKKSIAIIIGIYIISAIAISIYLSKFVICPKNKYIKILFLKLHFKLFIISLLYFFIFYYPSIIHIKYFITK